MEKSCRTCEYKNVATRTYPCSICDESCSQYKEKQPTLTPIVKNVLDHIKDDIEFGYDAQMILNKINAGNYNQ